MFTITVCLFYCIDVRWWKATEGSGSLLINNTYNTVCVYCFQPGDGLSLCRQGGAAEGVLGAGPGPATRGEEAGGAAGPAVPATHLALPGRAALSGAAGPRWGSSVRRPTLQSDAGQPTAAGGAPGALVRPARARRGALPAGEATVTAGDTLAAALAAARAGCRQRLCVQICCVGPPSPERPCWDHHAVRRSAGEWSKRQAYGVTTAWDCFDDMLPEAFEVSTNCAAGFLRVLLRMSQWTWLPELQCKLSMLPI